MKMKLKIAALTAMIGVGISASLPTFAQSNTPEWRSFSESDLQATSTGDLTRRVLQKHSIAEVRRAAEGDDPEAAWVLSFAYKRGLGGLPTDPRQAYRWSRMSCDLGSQRGCNALAYNLNSGVGTPQDRAEAMPLFQRTCAQGTASSCAAIAAAYYNGDSVLPQDFARALEFRFKGCELGRAHHCRIAGDMIAAGEGAEKSPRRAQAFYARGCDGQDAISCFRAARTRERLADRNDPSAFDYIASFYERGCALNQKDSCFNRGIIENEGKFGRTKSTLAAVPWMEKACELKSNDACYNLGSWLINGRAGRTDGRRAIELLGPLCLRDNDPDIQACNNAGTAAYRGSGMPSPDYESAAKFYTRACYEGALTASCRTLSDMYRDGQVVASSKGEAEWLDAQLCFKADEAAYCKPETVEHSVLQRASEGRYSSAAHVAGMLCDEGDMLACRAQSVLKKCASANGNTSIMRACRRAF
ncbi:sel1 repeat family protein [Erythrobacter sp. SCSIO 43205]|uniref:tetratricopeptide repeat protein n=1 Tax=Erythrobacter sp. SCSIO 43205 TaxID=2779361 RepID=UPI001CA9AC5F|nr:tetratricopeptide repeat protein [Erythrobacter sp. SCSIO 43205]UAB78165.1 sel1 repeat family protein [Erythrobacter sp. SCSIO 43205]